MNSLAIIEAETPKGFFKKIPSTRIWDGREYWVNVAKPGEDWMQAEFCPCAVWDNQLQMFDGMYGLLHDVSVALHYADGQGPEAEKRFEDSMNTYESAWHDNVLRGVTAGEVDGVAGPRRWRLVYWPDQSQARPRAIMPVQVRAGVPYGPKAPRDD